MLNALHVLERARNLGSQATLTTVQDALAAQDYAAKRTAHRTRYRVEVWDRLTPINGVSAEAILATRRDIPTEGVVYLVYKDDALLYFQPHQPGVAGIMPVTLEALPSISEGHVLQLVEADVDEEVLTAVLEALLQ
ncbi:MAG TPA: hypothetical protein VD969_19510 [Symbiobacteriaceae bacterium]|nr:hypothetical protein [Symbiobacteriaceae bacterium]